MSPRYQFDHSLAKETWNSLSAFERGYVETIFWLLTDEDGQSLSHMGLHDLSKQGLDRIKRDCEEFLKLVNSELFSILPNHLYEAGHDFWLTRNRHGAGFWDGDWPDDVGKKLTKLSHQMGECYAYLGDDNFVYLM